MSFQAGANVWVPCTVFRGPSTDKRNVRVDSPAGCWAGFVEPELLRDDISEGPTSIRVTIIEVGDLEISARLPGQTRQSTYLTCPTTWFREYGRA